MFSSKGNAPAQQVPSWKKSGSKHQQSAASESATATGSPTVGHRSSTHQGTPSKRKLDAHAPPQSNSSHVAKRPRKDETTGDRNEQIKKRKSVTFADATSKNDKTKNTKPDPTDTPQKKSKGPAKKQKAPAPTDLKPALEYLRLWKTARTSWKFNKNHQSTLIKHVFDADGIPTADIDAFYEYIKDLKGLVRMRLRESALEIRTKDRSQGGAVFPEGTADLDATQERYETILTKFLQSQQVGSKRKLFEEAEYLSDSDSEDEIIIRRLVKRMRAELVIEELSDGADTEMSTTSSSSSRTIAASDNATPNVDKRMKLNDGTGKRRRKLRTNQEDSDSSSSDSSSDSESDSDSDSDTSDSGSSSSSSDESSDNDDAGDRQDEDETSSSSSSSSDEADSEDSSSGEDSDDEDEGNAVATRS
ncbi:hypothetical protein BGZ61DRAFT_238879 [Ilyonectria robusta]|uniref:uncharacterized protein n=1 Tax=Ilyonectria robusta TaxID=1079257 RepID=UPI001E8CB504|nr:uncharacterized protein BGZ61DRAFT_238879 [Ilyonectria robusta]KAH8699896.1 hypothetical protein BGZ61DRAFT_238879 [Ilyonectria robusta]